MGALRLILAVMVVFHHLGAFPYIGHHAVLFFFLISGYLMTLVMQERYGYSLGGFGRFWTNRGLRLYPAYLFVIFLTVVLLSFFIGPERSTAYRRTLYLPGTMGEWLQNLTMVYANFFPNVVEPRLAPATWALTTELFFYLLISVGLSRSRKITLIWFVASVVYVMWCLLAGKGADYLYFALTAGSLPFSIGAMIYHYRGVLKASSKGWEGVMLRLAAISLVLIVGVRLAVHVVVGEDAFEGPALVLTTIPAFLATVSLMARPWSPFNRAGDRLAGDLSYPLYISHWGVGLAVSTLLGIASPSRGLDGLVLIGMSLPLSLLLSYFIIRVIDHRVEHLRQAIRARSEAARQAEAEGLTPPTGGING